MPITNRCCGLRVEVAVEGAVVVRGEMVGEMVEAALQSRAPVNNLSEGEVRVSTQSDVLHNLECEGSE